jgi:hypothetical protein
VIYYDISEAREYSSLPQNVVDYGLQFDNLEKITGADFVVLPEKSDFELVQELIGKGKNFAQIQKQLGINLQDVVKLATKDPETVLHEWLFAGALLVQRKSGFDFLNSMGPRLNESIAKMCEVGQKQRQRIVLAVGTFENKNGNLILNGKPTNYKYVSFLSAESSIKYKGACIDFVSSDDDILNWIEIQQKQLMKYKRESIKWIVSPVYYPPDAPELDDPLQLMRVVRDARLAMVNVPGWGSGKVNRLYKYTQDCLNIARDPTLLELLKYATSWETAKHCKGIGKTLISNARKYVGLEDGFLSVSDANITVQKGE